MTRRAATQRGQSEVLGTALLLGIIIIASGAIAAMALGAFSGTQGQADDRAIEQSMLELRSAAIDVGIEGVSHRTLLLEPPAESQMRLDPAATTFRVVHEGYDTSNPDKEELLYETTLGSLRITAGDRTYVFEGGGIFRAEAGRTLLIAPPPIGYRGLTANLAIIKLEGEAALGGPTNVRLSPGDQILPAFPDPSESYDDGNSTIAYDNPVENGSVKIVIESEYYEGWYRFFIQRATGSVTKDDQNQTVTVDLESFKEIVPTSAITYQNSFNTHGNPTIEGEVENTEFLIDSRPAVESKVDEASSDNDNENVDCLNASEGVTSYPCTLPAGTYYFNDSIRLEGNVEIDTTAGDVEIVADGHFDIKNNEIEVTDDTNNTVTYYVNGDLKFQGGAWVGTSNDEPEAYRNAFIIAGNVDDDDEGGGTVELDAIVYAPNADIDINGNLHLTGTLFTKSATLGGNDQVIYDESVERRALDLTAGRTPVMFLHITQNNVIINAS